jgi:hypothetical protein
MAAGLLEAFHEDGNTEPKGAAGASHYTSRLQIASESLNPGLLSQHVIALHRER